MLVRRTAREGSDDPRGGCDLYLRWAGVMTDAGISSISIGVVEVSDDSILGDGTSLVGIGDSDAAVRRRFAESSRVPSFSGESLVAVRASLLGEVWVVEMSILSTGACKIGGRGGGRGEARLGRGRSRTTFATGAGGGVIRGRVEEDEEPCTRLSATLCNSSFIDSKSISNDDSAESL